MKLYVKIITFLSLSTIAIALACCSGRSGFRQVFFGGASPGDLVSATIDTDKMTYEFKIESGNRAQKFNSAGSGKLKDVKNFEGLLYEGKGFVVMPIKDNVAVAKIIGEEEFFVGLPKQTTQLSPAELAGTYNYVRYTPNGLGGNRDDRAGSGTVVINADGTVAIKETGATTQIDTKIPDMTKSPLQLLETASGQNKLVANLIVKKDPNGRHFVNIDFDQANLAGIGFAQKQVSPITSGAIDGTYTTIFTHHNEPVEAKIKGDKITVKIDDNFSLTFDLTYNNPNNGAVSGGGAIGDALGETNRTIEFFGLFDHESKVFYGVMEFFKDSTGGTKKASLQKPAALIAVPKK